MLSADELKELFIRNEYKEINKIMLDNNSEFIKIFTELLNNPSFKFNFTFFNASLNDLLLYYLKNKLNKKKLNLTNNERSSIFYMKNRINRKYNQLKKINDELPQINFISELYKNIIKINKSD